MTAKQKAKSIVNEFWEVDPIWKLGSGNKDYSKALQYSIILCNHFMQHYYDWHHETESHYEHIEVRYYWNNVLEEVRQIELKTLKND